MRDEPKPRADKYHGREPALLDSRRLHELIARRAYELFEARGRGEGHECEDWIEAERQLLVELEPESVTISRPLIRLHPARRPIRSASVIPS